MSKSTNGLRKAGLASLAVTLTLGAGLVAAGSANAVEDFKFDRIAGADRFDTAKRVAVEFKSLQAYDEVILVNGQRGQYADALAAAHLAGDRQIPILLTKHTETPDFTVEALEANAVKTITIVGGEGVVSAEQEAALKADGYTVTRIEGIDRYKTNAEVLEAAGATTVDTGLVAAGNNFADALAGSPVAYKGSPLGLAKVDDIDDDVKDALVASGIKKVVILGGPTIVGPEVEAELKTAGLTVERVYGADRSETSMELADYAIENLGMTDEAANVASGSSTLYGADALSGGPLTGEENRPMLITMNVDKPGDLESWFEANANTLKEGIIFGGNGAVSTRVQELLEAAASSVTSNQDYTVTPAEAATLTLADETSTSANSDNRQYTVSGLDNTKTYVVQLSKAADITVADGGTVSFADVDKDDEADLTAPDAQLTVVNGSPAADGTRVEVSPVNGTITFTVDGVSYESVRPVVYLDADNQDDLDLDANNQPTEDFGVGGVTNFVPAEAAANANYMGLTVDSVNKDANSFIASNVDGQWLFEYDTNDKYTNDDAQATMATFESRLTVGDNVDVTDYQEDADLVSTFDLTNVGPAALAPTSSDAGERSIVLTFDEADVAEGATVNVYYAEDSAPADAAAPVYSSTAFTKKTFTADDDATAEGFQVTLTGLKPATAYQIYTSQTTNGDESDKTGLEESTDADTAPAYVDNSVTPNDVNDGVGSTNQIVVEFDQEVSVLDASKFTVNPTAQPSFVFTGTSATKANTSGTRWIITLDRTLQDAQIDVSYDLDVAADAVQDASGQKNTAASDTFLY